MNTWKLICALAGAAALVSGGPLRAAEIKVAVTDAAGGALPATSVALENVATGVATGASTDAGGRSSFPGVTVGIYRISVVHPGFSQDARTVSLLSSEEALEVAFALSVGGLTADVMVTAARSARDTLEIPLRAESISEAQLQDLIPTSTGDAMIEFPGITPVGDGPFQVRPRLRGLDSTRVLVLVDGERLNNARTATDRAGVEVGLVDVDTVRAWRW